MPGVDFRAVRDMISMSEVLELIGYASSAVVGDVLRGPCPVHRSKSTTSRSFAVNLQRKVYHCFSCGSAGNHLDLYAACTQKRVYHAALELCEKLHRQVPWIQRKI
jgi:DNA primase